MAVLFSKEVGQVISFPDPSLPANVSLRLENWGGFFRFKSVITRVTVAARGNYQFLHTLGGQVFVYAFGERIGDLLIQGFAFDSVCGSPVGLLGIESVLNYYAANRLAARATPLRVTIGASTTLRAYLLDVSGDVQDAKSRMWQFSLHLALIPSDTVGGSKLVGGAEITSDTTETAGEGETAADGTFAEWGITPQDPSGQITDPNAVVQQLPGPEWHNAGDGPGIGLVTGFDQQ